MQGYIRAAPRIPHAAPPQDPRAERSLSAEATARPDQAYHAFTEFGE
jgi:hypothetical protein